MSKAINNLLPEDFGKSFDTAAFNDWKKAANEHEQVTIINIVLYLAGLALMLVLGGFVGIGLFFVLAIIGLTISMPKMNVRRKCQTRLGITNKDLRNAIIVSKKRTKTI
jgi:Flp pilus assembly protein TadB